MRDPLLVDFNNDPIPEQRQPLGVSRQDVEDRYLNRDPRKFPGDLLVLFDKQHDLRKTQRRDRDLLINELLATRQKLHHANLKIWILGLIVSPVIAAVVKMLPLGKILVK